MHNEISYTNLDPCEIYPKFENWRWKPGGLFLYASQKMPQKNFPSFYSFGKKLLR